MKRKLLLLFTSALLCLCLSAVFLSGCVKNEAPVEKPQEIIIVPTVKPEADKIAQEKSTAVIAAWANAGGVGIEAYSLKKGYVLTVAEEDEHRLWTEIDGKRLLIRKSDAQLSEAGERATVINDGAPLYCGFLKYGQELEILTRGERLCVIRAGELTGRVPSWAVRTENEEPYVEWQGYAKEDTVLFAASDMNEPVSHCGVNTVVKVLFEHEDLLYVEINGKQGFVQKDGVSRKTITVAGSEKPDIPEDDWTPPTL